MINTPISHSYLQDNKNYTTANYSLIEEEYLKQIKLNNIEFWFNSKSEYFKNYSNTDSVLKWPDMSNNNNHAIQTNYINRPR